MLWLTHIDDILALQNHLIAGKNHVSATMIDAAQTRVDSIRRNCLFTPQRMLTRHQLSGTAKSFSAVALCMSLAYEFSRYLGEEHTRPIVPLMLLLVIISVAQIRGALCGIIAALMAGIVLQNFLYPPVGSLRITQTTDRIALIAFELTAVTVACLSRPGKTKVSAR
jgi:K+-sensing histidine kinase KdpD